jgi:hypothetical protein
MGKQSALNTINRKYGEMMELLFEYINNVDIFGYTTESDDDFNFEYPLTTTDGYIYLFDLKLLPEKIRNELINVEKYSLTDNTSLPVKLLNIKESDGWNYFGFRISNWKNVIGHDGIGKSIINEMDKVIKTYKNAIDKVEPESEVNLPEEEPFELIPLQLYEDEAKTALELAATDGKEAAAEYAKHLPLLANAILTLPDSILTAIRSEMGLTRGIVPSSQNYADRTALLKEISRTDPSLAELIKSRALGDVISGRIEPQEYGQISNILSPTIQGNLALDPEKVRVRGKIGYNQFPKYL